MWGEPAVAEANMILQQTEVCHVFSWRRCPWIMRPWYWWTTQAPESGGVDNDMCLNTGFLVAATAALAFHAHVWCLL